MCAVQEAVGRIEQNWESLYALGILTSITCRLLSLSSDSALVPDALRLLSDLRSIAFNWAQSLRSRYLQAQGDDKQKEEFRSKFIDAALIYSGTFDVETIHLESVLSDDHQAFILLRCHTLLYDHCPGSTSEFDKSLRPILRRRWQRLALRACPLLAKSILKNQGASLHEVMKASWPEYRLVGTPWTLAKDEIPYWVTRISCGDSNQTMELHYNLLTGKLLLNVLPISRLPPEYEEHSVYRELFGKVVLSVTPSTTLGMRFCAQRLHQEHVVHFGLRGTNLLLHATRNNRVLKSIPRHVFRGWLPHPLWTISFIG